MIVQDSRRQRAAAAVTMRHPGHPGAPGEANAIPAAQLQNLMLLFLRPQTDYQAGHG